MANREQVWTIVANFGSLSREAAKAARAIEKLDKARADANRNANTPLVSEKELTNMDKLSAAMERVSAARRKDTSALKSAVLAHNQATAATTRSTAARDADTQSLKAHSKAANKNSGSMANSVAASNQSVAASRKNSRSNAENTRTLKNASNAMRNFTGATGALARAFEATLPHSRSFGLIMKMLPLTAITSAVNSLAPAIASLGGAFIGLMGTLGPVLGLLGTFPTLLTAVAGSVGGLIAGLGSTFGAFGKYRKMQEAQDKAAAKSTTASAKSDKARQKQIRNMSRSILKAERDQVKAAKAVKDAQARVAETAEDNARSIRSAEKTVVRAQTEARAAQLAVNQARIDAGKAIEEYRDKLRGAILDEEGAAQELEKSRAALARVIADPGSTDLEERAARLSVRQAELRVDEMRKSNVELQKESEKAIAKGIEGSDQVVQAKQAEVEANESLADAQENLKFTQRDAAKASQAAADAVINAKESYAEGAERVKELKEDLADLKNNTDEAGASASAAATAAAEYEAALAKLSPAAREVVKELIKYSEAWEGISKNASEAISPGLLKFLQLLRVKLLPDISKFLTNMARGAGEFLGNLGELLTTDKSIAALRDMFEDSYEFMELMGESMLNLIEWMLGLGVAARKSGLTKYLGGIFKSWTKNWKSAVDTPDALANTVEGFKDAQYWTSRWGEALTNTWRFLRTFFKKMRPMGDDMLQGIIDVTERWELWAKSDSGMEKIKEWRELGKINLKGLSNTIRTITAQGEKMFKNIDFQKVWDSLNGDGKNKKGLINALGDILGIVNERMVTTLFDLGTAILGILQPIGEGGAMNAIIIFVNTLGDLAGIVSTLLTTVPGLGTALAGMLAIFASKKILVGLGALTGITPIFEAVGRAKDKGYKVGDGLGKASVKEFMGYGNTVVDRSSDQGEAIYQSKNRKNTPLYIAQQEVKQAQKAQKEYDKQFRRNRMFGTPITAEKPLIGAASAAQNKVIDLGGKPTRAMTAFSKVATGAGTALRGIGTAALGVLGPIGLITVAIMAVGGSIDWLKNKYDSSIPTLEKVLDISRRAGENSGALNELFNPGEGWFKNHALNDVKTVEDAGNRIVELKDRLSKQGDRDWWGWLKSDSTVLWEGQLKEVQDRLKLVDEASKNMSFTEAQARIEQLVIALQKTGVTAEDVTKTFPSMAEAAKAALTDLKASGQDVEISAESIARVLAGDLPDGLLLTEQGFRTAAQAAEEGAKILSGKLPDGYRLTEDGVVVLIGSLEDLEDQRKRTDKAAEKERENLDKSTKAYKDNKKAVEDLNDAQREASGRFMSEFEAQGKVAELLEENKTRENKKGEGSLNKDATGFNAKSAIGRENATFVFSVANAYRDLTDSMLKSGKGIKEVNAEMSVQREAFIAMLGEYGIVGAAAEEYADQVGLIPNYATTEVMLRNANLTEEQIKNILKELDGLSPEQITEIQLVAVRDGYDEAMDLLANMPRSKNIPINFEINGVTTRGIKINAGTAQESIKFQNGLVQKASGGLISGPGTGTSDSIPALLSDGEYVVKASSAKSLGTRFLNYLNTNGKVPKSNRFASGGPVGPTMASTTVNALKDPTIFAGVFIDIAKLQTGFNNLGSFLSSWGKNATSWWGSLWSVMGALGTVSVAGMSTSMQGIWTPMWSNMTTTASTALSTTLREVSTVAGNMVRVVSGLVPAMSGAWSAFMGTMRTPITDAIKFLNSTLGEAVLKVSSFYGVTGTPFPVKTTGFSDGGYTGPGGRLQPAGIVHADEYVIKKSSRRRIEQNSPGLLDYMNRTGKTPGYSSGGRVKPVGSAAESRSYSGHSGIDYRVGIGTPVRAADGGTILSTIRKTTSYGWHIIQRLENGIRAVYAHLSGFNTSPGATVTRGQVIGRSGNSGNSKGPHLHFEIAPGSTGNPANRGYTRAWLAGTALDPNLITGGDYGMGLTPDLGAEVVAGVKQKLSEFTQAQITPWGKVIAGVVGKLTDTVTNNLMGTASGADVTDGPIPISGTGEGDSTKVNFRGHVFSNRFANAILAAEKLAGVKFNISKGGFRPFSALSGTSHQGDAIDIAGPINSKVINALRASGIAAWDRTGKRNFRPHIHGVPLPGFGYGAGSAIWQAKDYLNGGDGIGRARSTNGSLSTKKAFANGGWTGRGSKYRVAGIVHADEFVISKDARRSIESSSPGLLDHMNDTGELPGYAKGGKVKTPAKTVAKKAVVKKAPFVAPRLLRNMQVYLSYLRKAETWDAANPKKRLPELVKHVQMVENLLAYEGGLLSRKDANGIWDKADAEAWKKWQERNKMTVTGKIDDDSLSALVKKNGIKYNNSLPFVSGIAQPSNTDVLQNKINTTNSQQAALNALIQMFRAKGYTYLADYLKDLGPAGIPEEFRDSINPITGLQLAKQYSNNNAAARKYNESLKQAAAAEGKADAITTKLEEMMALLNFGPDQPYGLQGIARELGISIDTAAELYRRLVKNGSLKNLSSTKTSRIRRDVVDFDSLFKFAKGGIVPGTGNQDSVLAWLTPGELVVPKDIVSGMFQTSAPQASFAEVVSRGDVRKGTAGTGVVNNFNTNVYNPVAEEPSTSVQKKVKSIAMLGMLGR